MTIQEAIKSEKPFRRRNVSPQKWYFVSPNYRICCDTKNGGVCVVALNAHEIIEDDWEVKE